MATVAPATSSEHARVPPGGLDSGEPAAGITAEADVMETVRLESPSRTASARAYGMVLAMTLAAQDAPGAVEGPAPDEPRDYSRSPPRTVQDAFGTFERKIASDRAALSWLQNRVVQLQSEMERCSAWAAYPSPMKSGDCSFGSSATMCRAGDRILEGGGLKIRAFICCTQLRFGSPAASGTL